MSTARAFTSFELLVTCAVIGVLVAILLPTIALVRKQAQLAVCASNLRQIGIAAQGYASDNRNAIPDIASKVNGIYYDWPDNLASYCAAADRTDYGISKTTTGKFTVLWNCPRWRGHEAWSGLVTSTSTGVGMNSYPLRTSYSSTTPNYWTHCNSSGSWGLYYYRTIRLPMISQPSSRIFFADSNDWHTSGNNATAPALWVDAAWNSVGRRHDERTNAIFFDLHIQTLPLVRVADSLIGL